jgi:hypothetical protein
MPTALNLTLYFSLCLNKLLQGGNILIIWATKLATARQTQANIDALSKALTEQLVAENTFEEDDAELAKLAAECGCEMTPEDLSEEDRREINRFAWSQHAGGLIVALLRPMISCTIRSSDPSNTVRFSDEDIQLFAKAFIAAPVYASTLGLDNTNRHRVAEVVATLFCDRTRLLEPTAFAKTSETDAWIFIFQRDGDHLVVRKVPQ